VRHEIELSATWSSWAVEPERAPLDQLLALLDDLSLWFNIIEP
jgi:hypothetical protein